jgi:hypothetical protein
VRRLVLAVITAVALTLAVTTSLNHSVPNVPPCQEDEVLVGQGDFHASGYWDRLVCQNLA